MKKREIYFIAGKQLNYLLNLRTKSKKVPYVTLNLDLQTTDKQYRVYIREEGVFFHHFEILLPWEKVKKYSKKPELLYAIEENGIQPLLFFKDRVYRILATIPPSLELDGIRMHTKKVAEDVKKKIEYLKIRAGSLVLDTACGFGYTAIEASKVGAKVITIEKDPFVIELAKINPYSQMLFHSKNIKLIIADVYYLNFKEEIFDYIIHDPPRLTKNSG
ncbi:MAG: methyltransferase domain-containing protein, partial [Candidatus Methanomethylicia archaeon]